MTPAKTNMRQIAVTDIKKSMFIYYIALGVAIVVPYYDQYPYLSNYILTTAVSARTEPHVSRHSICKTTSETSLTDHLAA